MIERFNFYDLYGYAIPGFLLVLFLWLPRALTNGQEWPSGVLSAVIGAVIAYVAGHLLQAVAGKTVQSKRAIRDAERKIHYRFPSDYLFDENDATFTPEQKQRIGAKIRTSFGVTDPSKAFLSCRNALVAAKAAAYAEQFEGMYVLMRGICAASVVGLAFMVGCLWQAFVAPTFAAIALLALVAIVACVFRHEQPKPKPLPRAAFAMLIMAIAVCSGMVAGSSSLESISEISFAALVLVLVALWTFGAYMSFAEQFAKTVYLNFDLLDLLPPKNE